MDQESIIRQIIEKFQSQGENPMMYFKGFLEAKPVNYWDYVNVEALLSLQQPRTDYVDEENFIIYSQVTELLLKSILHELKQITGVNEPSEEILINKLTRLNKYTELLINFFGMMSAGVDYDQYSKFRLALAPASGFQSAQFRFVEIYCTRIENLLNDEGKKLINKNTSVEECFENLYWKDAGINRKTGKKTLTLRQFEEKYQERFISLAKELRGNTLEDKVLRLPEMSSQLKEKLKQFDQLYNVKWPLEHIKTASFFLEEKGQAKKGTGGTEWRKYLHPQYQKRKFFPSLLTQDELEHWGSDNL